MTDTAHTTSTSNTGGTVTTPQDAPLVATLAPAELDRLAELEPEVPAPKPKRRTGCICGQRDPVAGLCVDIDGNWWNGHGPVAP